MQLLMPAGKLQPPARPEGAEGFAQWAGWHWWPRLFSCFLIWVKLGRTCTSFCTPDRGEAAKWLLVFPLSLSVGLWEKERGRKKSLCFTNFYLTFSLGKISWGGFPPQFCLAQQSQHACGNRRKFATVRFSGSLGEQRGRSEDIQRIKTRELKQKGFKTMRRKK